jgi:teichuronic acid biosynthesis glycosyltransferase TuaG
MTSDLVSIVTPAYKAARFVAESIRSVQGQDHANWEMLIVDDGSPDDTASVVQGYADRDSRVKLLRQANAGPAMARQTAVAAARGGYIAFLDSDDYWLPGKLTRQLAFMAETDAPLSYTRYRRIDPDGARLGHLVEVPDSLDYRSLLSNTAIATSTVIVDRAKTGPFKMTKAYYDDFVLWLELLKRGFTARGLQEDLMRYRVVGKSVSRNKLRSAREVWRTYRRIEGLSMPHAAWCFGNYAYNSVRKHRRF